MDNSEQQKRDEQFMRRALDEALAAREAGEIPVGAVKFDYHPAFGFKSGDELFQ